MKDKFLENTMRFCIKQIDFTESGALDKVDNCTIDARRRLLLQSTNTTDWTGSSFSDSPPTTGDNTTQAATSKNFTLPTTGGNTTQVVISANSTYQATDDNVTQAVTSTNSTIRTTGNITQPVNTTCAPKCEMTRPLDNKFKLDIEIGSYELEEEDNDDADDN